MIKWKNLLGVTDNWREEKADYKKFKKRVENLPEDYKFVFNIIQSYLWEFADYTGRNTLAAINDLLLMFEDGVENGQDVFSITGEDVGEFANDIVSEIANTWLEGRKTKLNKKVEKFRKNHVE